MRCWGSNGVFCTHVQSLLGLVERLKHQGVGQGQGQCIKIGEGGCVGPASKKCTNSGVLDAGHLIPEFAVSILGLRRETDHGSL